jgi:predicted ATP-grasp superfamily ATP-dependent carboligase
MKIMLLDGQYSHSLPIAAELSRHIEAEILGVAPNGRAHLHRSRFVDRRLTAPIATDPRYLDRVLELVDMTEPDLLVPVGYHSFRLLIDARSSLPPEVALMAPSASAFDVAEDKSQTYRLAASLGVRSPREYAGDSADLRDLDFPIFAKARKERGGASTALISDASQLAAFVPESLGGDVILQEYIDADPYTYGHCGYFRKGRPLVDFQHLELRSVPRRGGSGTRLRSYSDPALAEQANALLQELEWDGVAQVEFKRARDGSYVLMEINPKFWASYALASRAGACIAATGAADLLGLQAKKPNAKMALKKEMVFPVREASYVFKNKDHEGYVGSLKAMLWPPASIDLELSDLLAGIPVPGSTSYRRMAAGSDRAGEF